MITSIRILMKNGKPKVVGPGPTLRDGFYELSFIELRAIPIEGYRTCEYCQGDGCHFCKGQGVIAIEPAVA